MPGPDGAEAPPDAAEPSVTGAAGASSSLSFYVEVSPGTQTAYPSVADAAFVPLAGPLQDSGAGFSLAHLPTDTPPVVPGALFAYRARRYDSSTGLYSDYSPVALARAPYPYTESIMSLQGVLDTVITGAQAEVGIALEDAYGFPCKAQKKLELRSINPKRTLQKLFSQALRNAPTRYRKVVAGRASLDLSATVEVTPEGGFLYAMKATFPDAVTGAASPYVHRFANKFGAKSVTLIVRIGNYLFVLSGCRVHTLGLNVSAETNDILLGSLAFHVLAVWVYDLGASPGAYAAWGMDTAGTDTLPPYTSVDAVSNFGGSLGTLQTLDLSVSKDMGAKKTLDGKRGMSQYFEQKAAISGKSAVYFEDLTNVKRDFGLADATAAPFGVGDAVIVAPVSVTFYPTPNGSGFQNLLTLALPNAATEADEDVKDDKAVMQDLTFTPIDAAGDASGTDAYIEVTNSVSDTTLSTTGTAVANVPAQSMTGAFTLAAAAGGTTTVFAADAANAASLSTTDNDPKYLAKSIRFLSGTNQGAANVQKITAYVAATRQFTVGAAFGSAPAVGDIFCLV